MGAQLGITSSADAPSVSANALNASAVVFENVYDVDNKFAKFIDRECEAISSEVKKWFKKLAVRLFPFDPPHFITRQFHSTERGETSRRQDGSCERENKASRPRL